MKKIKGLLFGLCVCVAVDGAVALSESLPVPRIFFPKGYDTNRAAQINAALDSKPLDYLDGLTSYWEPDFSTTLVYGGDGEALNVLLAKLNGIDGLRVRLSFSQDLAREAGSAMPAGNWRVDYSHTTPDMIRVRINLAAEAMEKLELDLPRNTRAQDDEKSRKLIELDEAAVLTIARRAVSERDSWIERAEFQTPRRREDGLGWSVVVWRVPKQPGGFRIVFVDPMGQVTNYVRGH
jgi:hypothetical protein